MKISEFYKGKNVLVTGDTGFKGSWLCTWLYKLGANVSGLSLTSDKTSHYDQLKLFDKIKHYRADIRDYYRLKVVIDEIKPEIIFHLAGQPVVGYAHQEPKVTFDINATGAINLLEIIRESEYVKSAVFVTTDKVYKNREWSWGYRENDEIGDDDPYSASKSCMELVCRSYDLTYLRKKGDIGFGVARAGNVIGGGDWTQGRLIPNSVKAIQDNQYITVSNPEAVRPWQFILDILYGYLLLGMKLYGNNEFSGAWNFGPDISSFKNVKEVVEVIIDLWGKGKYKISNNSEFKECGLLFLNTDKARLFLDWKSLYSFMDVLSLTVSWYRDFFFDKDVCLITNKQIDDYMSLLKSLER